MMSIRWCSEEAISVVLVLLLCRLATHGVFFAGDFGVDGSELSLVHGGQGRADYCCLLFGASERGVGYKGHGRAL